MASVGPFQGPICPFLGRLVRMVCQATDERLVSAGSLVGWLTVRPTGGPPTVQSDPRSGDGNPAPHGRRAS